jgi:Family of unknown function (DUF6599)
MRNIIILILLIVSMTAKAQIPEGFPVLGRNDLPEARFQPARYFTAESLFGYMDGGAELYREYGIDYAVITEFDVEGRHYKCEIFRMRGTEEAFGIYSVSKYKCLGSPSLFQFSCRNKYQLQICKGQYYINIINRSGTAADSLVMLKTGEILDQKISEPAADLSEFIPDVSSEDLRGNSILAKGKLGLANGAPEWEGYFKDQTGYCALIYKAQDRTILSVRFSDPEDFRLFISFHGWGICELSVTDVTISTGETIRLMGDNHLLIKINPATGNR